MVAISCGTAAAQASTPAGSPPAATSALTMAQAVREALDHNLNLTAEKLNEQVADTAVLTAAIRPNPVITVTVTRPDQNLIDAGVSPYEQVFRTDYVVERGDKRDRRIDQASLAKSVTQLQAVNTARLLILDVESAFTDLQLAQMNLALARDNLTAFNDVVQVNTERVRAGDLASVELARSRLAALQFQNDVRQRETKLAVARVRLATLLGRTSADGLEATGDLRRDAEPIDLAVIARQADMARPDLRAVRADQARSAADLRLQLANGKIDYTVSGELHRQEGSAGVHGNAYVASVSAPLPIFNRNQGETARARVQAQQLRARIAALEHDISSEVSSAYAGYANAREILGTIEGQMLVQARDVRTTMEYSYRRGEASFVELLDAVRAFNDTMQGYNEARADYARSLYTLDAISGKVDP
jgi:cobalt-zinc-cadmium efflux system outer membrane protein